MIPGRWKLYDLSHHRKACVTRRRCIPEWGGYWGVRDVRLAVVEIIRTSDDVSRGVSGVIGQLDADSAGSA
jgi:hypothetical protein